MGVAMSMYDDDCGSDTVQKDASSAAPATTAAARQPDVRNRDGGTTTRSHACVLSPCPEVDWMKDWIDEHFFRFFRDVEGFHLGNLDLMGRHPSRYAELRRKWDAYLKDFDLLTPYVSRADVDRAHFDLAAREWVYEEYPAEGVTHRKLWDAFRRKWNLREASPASNPMIRYEDLAALTGHARGIVAAHLKPKFQKILLDNMPPEIIHAIFSHISEQYQDGHNLAATSKFFHEIGCSHVFEFRNIVFGADKVLQKLDARAPPTDSALAEIREKMDVDRFTLLEHLAFLASRPDICRRIRTMRFANNWANPALVGPGADDICRWHLDDHSTFEPVLRALGDLLARVSLARLDLEFISLDEGLVHGICAQEYLVEVNLKGCVLQRVAREFCLGAVASPARSKIRYLGLTHVRFPPASSIWDFLALCPDLLSLQATGASQHSGFGIPTMPRLTALFPILRSLERLELYFLVSTEVATVSTWLHSTDHPLRLNHVKLISNFGIPDEEAALLLRALHRGRPPLRTLMLDGLALRGRSEGTPPVLDLIAELFPDLEGLAIGHRTPGMDDSRPWGWPQFMHTYAPPLRAFTRLRTFGANFDIWNSGVSTSPRAHFYPYGVPNEYFLRRVHDARNPELSEELLCHVLAAPFAAACPSLRYFVATGVWSMPQYCVRIGRTEAGVMSMEDTVPCDPHPPEVVRLYNPSRLLRYD